MSDLKKKELARLVTSGKTVLEAARLLNIQVNQAREWIRECGIRRMKCQLRQEKPKHRQPQILTFDIEMIGNVGSFWNRYNDKAPIPMDAIYSDKSIVTIAWKWLHKDKAKVCTIADFGEMHDAHDDKKLLERFLQAYYKADYVIGHNVDKFDIKMLAGRIAINNLPGLPPVKTVDTLKMARKRWGDALNSNKLDDIAKKLGVGEKIPTDFSLWRACEEKDVHAIRRMAEYNVRDVEITEKVFLKLRKYVPSGINMNQFYDDCTNRCYECGSENIELKGQHYTPQSFKHRFLCGDCGSWSSFGKKKV